MVLGSLLMEKNVILLLLPLLQHLKCKLTTQIHISQKKYIKSTTKLSCDLWKGLVFTFPMTIKGLSFLDNQQNNNPTYIINIIVLELETLLIPIES
jgi:hypothetical protein